MNKVKVVLGTLLAVGAVASAVGVLIRALSHQGSAFESGQLAGSIVVTCFLAAGSVMLFKSARGTQNSEKESFDKRL
jgi:Ca2+/Na+ antiporter